MLDQKIFLIKINEFIEIQKSVNDFLQALDEYAVGVFFYAGHGMQIDGKNFIVPIDLKLSDKKQDNGLLLLFKFAVRRCIFI